MEDAPRLEDEDVRCRGEIDSDGAGADGKQKDRGGGIVAERAERVASSLQRVGARDRAKAEAVLRELLGEPRERGLELREDEDLRSGVFRSNLAEFLEEDAQLRFEDVPVGGREGGRAWERERERESSGALSADARQRGARALVRRQEPAWSSSDALVRVGDRLLPLRDARLGRRRRCTASELWRRSAGDPGAVDGRRDDLLRLDRFPA